MVNLINYLKNVECPPLFLYNAIAWRFISHARANDDTNEKRKTETLPVQ